MRHARSATSKAGRNRHSGATSDRKSTRLNSSHRTSSYADFCLKKKTKRREPRAGGKRGTLAGLPPTLPPLLMAYRLQKRAAGIGFYSPYAKCSLARLQAAFGEV